MVGLVALAVTPASHAAFPGQNGKILFSSERDEPGNVDLYTMDPDGSNVTRLTTDPAIDRFGRWSPDGQRILFRRHFGPGANTWYVIDADGNGQTATTLPNNTIRAAWSPDGQKIAYTRNGVGAGIWTANPDGSAAVLLGGHMEDCTTFKGPYRELAWSPDGEEIAFTACALEGGLIATVDADGSDYQSLTPLSFHSAPDWSPDAGRITWWGDDGVSVMNRDGSGQTTIASGRGPIWSPDGAKIAFQQGSGIALVNPDGSGQTTVSADGTLEDWQPIPVNGYPRPKSASPLRVSLVPAYIPCATPNRTHGPPLAFDSCNPPAQASSALTVGTPDANGAAPASIGSLRLKAVGELPIDLDNGDQSDVEIDVSVTDVRNASDLTDHTGELTVKIGRRITDKDNTPSPGGPGAATTQDDSWSFDVPCAATGGAAGATCALTTTADTLVPGTVTERQRAIWQLDRVTVHDASDDPFLTQGIFIP